MTHRFGITFDYLCPFARNGNEQVIAALRDGADLEVDWMPFSLAQAHVEEADPAVWDQDAPEQVPGVLALQAGLAIRDHLPERFLDAHEQLFAARHDHGQDIKDPQVIREALTRAEVDADEVFAHIEDGSPLATLREEHQAASAREIFGVPTFVTEQRAVFVRILSRPNGDGGAYGRIKSVLELIDGDLDLHEFKQADLPY
ncbi:MAG: DsbA family protein [Nitriliruptoraceae bacterium]